MYVRRPHLLLALNKIADLKLCAQNIEFPEHSG
jgi:hypothetical protein